MRIVFLLFLSLGMGIGAEPQDLPDYTPQVSIRSLHSANGMVVRLDRPNWKIREFDPEDERLKYADPYKKDKLGWVQFTDVKNENVCLAIDKDGVIKPKTCFEDITNHQYETIFTIIPTSTDAVQLKSLGNGGTFCVIYAPNPKAPRGRPFGLRQCNFDPNRPIDTTELFLILPPTIDAKVTNP